MCGPSSWGIPGVWRSCGGGVFPFCLAAKNTSNSWWLIPETIAQAREHCRWWCTTGVKERPQRVQISLVLSIESASNHRLSTPLTHSLCRYVQCRISWEILHEDCSKGYDPPIYYLCGTERRKKWEQLDSALTVGAVFLTSACATFFTPAATPSSSCGRIMKRTTA